MSHPENAIPLAVLEQINDTLRAAENLLHDHSPSAVGGVIGRAQACTAFLTKYIERARRADVSELEMTS